MYEKSTTERYREMLQQSVDTEVIRQAPDLDPGDEHHSVVEIQNFLKRFGYVDAVAEDRTPEPGRLDGVTVRALKEFQRTYKVGAGTGTLDAPTRELMAAPRCGMPDRLPGPSPRSIPPRCAWSFRRHFTYAFHRVTHDLDPAPGSGLPPVLGQVFAMQAVGKAFNTWAEAGVGLEFTEVELNQDPDIVVDWRAAFCADEGFSMIGSPVAHSDGPIGCSIIPTAVELHEKRNALPKPIHFDQEETRWGLEWGTEGEGRIPIEDAAVHEIGHFLGLDHSEANPPPGYVIDPPPGNVMHPTLGWSGRTLGPDDLFNIGRAYPPLRNWISSFKSDLILDVVASSQDNGAKIQQSRPRGSSLFSFNPNQRFRVEKVGQPQGFPEYRIIAVHSGKVLDVDWDFRFPTANGAQVQQWDWHGGPNQRFRVRPERMDSRGTVYRIIAVHSGKVLDVDLNSPTPDGARIQQWDWLGGDNQLWRFI